MIVDKRQTVYVFSRLKCHNPGASNTIFFAAFRAVMKILTQEAEAFYLTFPSSSEEGHFWST